MSHLHTREYRCQYGSRQYIIVCREKKTMKHLIHDTFLCVLYAVTLTAGSHSIDFVCKVNADRLYIRKQGSNGLALLLFITEYVGVYLAVYGT